MIKKPVTITCTTAKSVLTPAAFPDIAERFPLVKASWLESPIEQMLVARQDETIVGLLLYMDSGSRIYAQVVAVDESCRMNGIGATLADCLQFMARQRGCSFGSTDAVSDGGRGLIARQVRQARHAVNRRIP